MLIPFTKTYDLDRYVKLEGASPYDSKNNRYANLHNKDNELNLLNLYDQTKMVSSDKNLIPFNLSNRPKEDSLVEKAILTLHMRSFSPNIKGKNPKEKIVKNTCVKMFVSQQRPFIHVNDLSIDINITSMVSHTLNQLLVFDALNQ